jgi:hypothetical protein
MDIINLSIYDIFHHSMLLYYIANSVETKIGKIHFQTNSIYYQKKRDLTNYTDRLINFLRQNEESIVKLDYPIILTNNLLNLYKSNQLLELDNKYELLNPFERLYLDSVKYYTKLDVKIENHFNLNKNRL